MSTCICGHPKSDHAFFPPGIEFPACKQFWSIKAAVEGTPRCTCLGFEDADEFELTEKERAKLIDSFSYPTGGGGYTYDPMADDGEQLFNAVSKILRKRMRKARRRGNL